jgi:hypothetical protein
MGRRLTFWEAATIGAPLALVLLLSVFRRTIARLFFDLGVPTGTNYDIVDTIIVAFLVLLFAAIFTCLLLLLSTPRQSDRVGKEYALWKVRLLSKKYKSAAVAWILAGRVLQIVSVLAGIIVAGVASQGDEFPGAFGLSRNTLIIVVSGVGSAAAALLTQLRFEALARGREIARVGLESELFRARTSFVDQPPDNSTTVKILEEMGRRITEIEYDQIDHVFPPQEAAKNGEKPP